MLFDRPYTRGRSPCGSFDLVTWSNTLEVRVVSNHSILPISHDSVLPCNRSVLLSLLWGGYFAIMSVPCCSGVLTHKYSRHSVEVRSMLNLSVDF